MKNQEQNDIRASAFYTIRTFQAVLGGEIGLKRLYQFLNDGKIRHVKVGTKSLIPSSELEDFPKRLLEKVEN